MSSKYIFCWFYRFSKSCMHSTSNSNILNSSCSYNNSFRPKNIKNASLKICWQTPQMRVINSWLLMRMTLHTLTILQAKPFSLNLPKSRLQCKLLHKSWFRIITLAFLPKFNSKNLLCLPKILEWRLKKHIVVHHNVCYEMTTRLTK